MIFSSEQILGRQQHPGAGVNLRKNVARMSSAKIKGMISYVIATHDMVQSLTLFFVAFACPA
jgi:hypothetical protein